MNPLSTPVRATMNRKPVFEVPAKSIINFESGFEKKLLCSGPTFSTGTACVYKCSFCYVPDAMRKSPHLVLPGGAPRFPGTRHEDIVIRRSGAIEAMRLQLIRPDGRLRFADPADRRVIYASPLVDVAANLELVRETVEACQLILSATWWTIRLLSKSNLLPKVAQSLDTWAANWGGDQALEMVRSRVIYGVSTGTLDDKLAAAFEEGTALVSKRIASLHWLQDHGYRTFGMLCPSLPSLGICYDDLARDLAAAIRTDRCEHVWAEVINVRGDSMTATVKALADAGYHDHAAALLRVSTDPVAWQLYARAAFEAHAPLYPPGKLRFLQYVTKAHRPYWESQVSRGAILL